MPPSRNSGLPPYHNDSYCTDAGLTCPSYLLMIGFFSKYYHRHLTYIKVNESPTFEAAIGIPDTLLPEQEACADKSKETSNASVQTSKQVSFQIILQNIIVFDILL